MFTGLLPFEHGADRGMPLDDTPRTLAEALGDHGYRTAGFVANRFWAGRATGLDRGFERYQDRGQARRIAMPYLWALSKPLLRRVNGDLAPRDNPDRVSAEMIHAAFLDWVDQEDDRPFFGFLNLFDAHDPYEPPESFGFHFGISTQRTTWDVPEAGSFTTGDVQQLRDSYHSSIYYLDHQFGVLVQELEARGLLVNTVVIVTSDHGETLGEHRPELFGHANNIFADVLKVPLVVYAPPGLLADGRRAAPVSLVDLPATILDLVGARESPPFPGTSLLPELRSASATPRGARPSVILSQLNPPAGYQSFPGWPASRGTLRSLLGVRWHYLVDSAGREQLFDVQGDPEEARDLSGTAAAASVLAEMRTELRRQVSNGRP
jgi:arylsulfatase A-like enzyme